MNPQESPGQQAASLAGAVGIAVPEPRLVQLAIGLTLVRASVDTLLSHDLGGHEPASRFVPPPPR
jgi:hypothetical protein